MRIRLLGLLDRDHSQGLSVEVLEAVTQHRSVDLLKHAAVDVHDEVRADTHDVSIVGRVVDLAESKAIAHDRVSAWKPVSDDVSSVEQVLMPERAAARAAKAA